MIIILSTPEVLGTSFTPGPSVSLAQMFRNYRGLALTNMYFLNKTELMVGDKEGPIGSTLDRTCIGCLAYCLPVEESLMETAYSRNIVRVQLVPAGAVWGQSSSSCGIRNLGGSRPLSHSEGARDSYKLGLTRLHGV